VDEILGQVLRNAVWERLDMLTEPRAGDRSPDSSPNAAAAAADRGGEIFRLVEGWRSMLAAHEPDQRGDCPECSSRWRRQRSPCAIWRSAYEHLVDGGLAPRPTKHAGPGTAYQPTPRVATVQ
jgi:hypothetical protein